MESRNAKFLENDLTSGNGQFQDIVSVKDQLSTLKGTIYFIHQNIPMVRVGVRQKIDENPQKVKNILVDQIVHKAEQVLEHQVENMIIT